MYHQLILQSYFNTYLRVISSSTNMTGAVRSPGNRIDTCLMSLQLCNRYCGNTDVQDHHFWAVHQNSGHVTGVLFVPSKTQEGCVRLCTLIDNGRMLLISQVKHPYRAICRDRSKYTGTTPSYVVYFFVMCNKLGVYNFFFNVPNSTCCVYAWCSQALWLGLVPIKRCQGGTIFTVLIVVQEALQFHLVIMDL